MNVHSTAAGTTEKHSATALSSTSVGVLPRNDALVFSSGGGISLPVRLSGAPSRVVVSRRWSCEVDRQVGRSLARRALSLHCAGRPPGPRRQRYQPLSSPCRRSAPRGLVHLGDWPDAPGGTPSARHEWRVRPLQRLLLRRRPATLARRRSRRRCLRFRGQSDREESFDTRLAQDAVAQPSGVLLRVNGHPDFLA